MAISKVKNYTVAPYYDDYDETKNYHRILFRPGFAVQARELTQLQTALQAQIDKHGQFAFADGSRVVSANHQVHLSYDYIKLEDVFASTVATGSAASYTTSGYVSEFVGTTITGHDNSGNQVKAKVLGALAAGAGPAHTTNTNDPITLYIKYIASGGANKTVSKFAAGEVVTSDAGTVRHGKVMGETVQSTTEYVGASANGVSALNDGTHAGTGSSFNIEEGVYFISGCFVHVPSQTLILNKYNNIPSYRIGLKITESIVTSTTDASLADNAQGVPNTAAPGANRYQITTALIAEPLAIGSRTVDNYISLIEIENGITSFNSLDVAEVVELNTKLNDRTFEESGNYAINPFILDIREDFNDGSNFGRSTSGSATKFNVGIEKNIAYVQGNRIHTGSSGEIIADKPRAASDKQTITGLSTTLPVGNYVKLTASTVRGIPDVTSQKTLSLKDSGGTERGTARAKGLEFDGTFYRLYLYDIVMNANYGFGSITQVTQAAPSGFSQGLAGTLNPVGTRFESSAESLVYKLPINVLAEDGNTDTFTYNARFRETDASCSSNTATFTLPTGVKLANDDDIQVAVNGGATVEATSVASGIGAQTFTLTTASGSFTIATGDKVQVIVNGLVTNSRRRTKVLVTGTTKTITGNGSSSYSLDKTDAVKLTSLTRLGVDYKDKFILDNGQRESYYDVAKIVLKGGETIANGSYVATFDHFTHNSGDFFDVNSYDSGVYTKIPTFNSSKGLLELRDCLDFRSVKGSGSPTAGAEMSTGTDFSTAYPPAPNTIFSFTSNTKYLPRLDKLVLTSMGEYKYITGTSALNPEAPEDVVGAMTLYTLAVSPYVFDMNGIKPIPVDNKRYTMRDIGKIDKRVKNLEYYTSLSLLEKSAAGTELFTGTNNRFKNGFLVDGFYGHNVGNPNSNDHTCAIDNDKGVLRPKFDERTINMVRTAGDLAATPTTGIDNKAVLSAAGGLVTLPYTNVNYIEQPYATYAEYINPYDVFVWEGKMKLSPESDTWKEVDVRPDIIIDDNSVYDQFVATANEEGIFGTVWNEWETNWTGRDTSTTSTRLDVDAQEAGELGYTTTDSHRRAIIKETTTATTLTGTQSRSGLTTGIASDTQLKEVGSFVVETNFIPFMRSRKIYFDAELLKPDTKLYAFFGGSNVTAYCRQEFADNSAPYAHVAADLVEFSSRTGIKTYETETQHPTATSGGSTRGALVSDGSGRCIGSLIIPRNSALKFKTGTSEFKLTESSTDASTAETKASAFYYAQGLLEVQQKTIISTKIPRLVTREIREDGAQVTETRRTSETELVKWYDPLAQTFTIDPSKSAAGIFAQSLDLYFETKDAEIPVDVSIRSVVNGYPTQEIVPGTWKTIYPGDVNVHDKGTTATNVVFDHPVYLEAGQEYAIVLIANSASYKLWVADVGGFDVADTTKRVVKQPYNGVFFTSANASTWTAEQTKDLKFKLNRCSFTDDTAEIIMNNDVLPTKRLGSSPFEYLTNSTHTTIRVNHPNHNMYGDGNSHVTLAGFVAENGLTTGNINTTHQLSPSTIEHDSYVITISNVACTNVGIIGGGTAMTATENQMYNVIKPTIQTIELPDTSIKLYLTPKTGASQDSGASAWGNGPVTQILPNKNFTTPEVYGVAGAATEAQNSTGKTVILRAVLDNGGNNFISPVIDMERCEVVCVSNRINDPSATAADYSANSRLVAETNAAGVGGTAVSKYLTKKVELAEEADLLDIYLGVNRPTGSNIDVYYRAQESGSDANFNAMPWVLATSDNAIPINDAEVYTDVHYAIDPVVNSVGYKFGAFGVKIVFRSSNSSKVPTVTDLRAIATT
jgi:hypothetical protein